jgi:hypothetical protein
MTGKSLENYNINVKLKLALLWASLMFLYIYADYFELMTPGKLEKMMQLKTPMGPTSPDLLIIFAILLIIPALMIIFSASIKQMGKSRDRGILCSYFNTYYCFQYRQRVAGILCFIQFH